MEECELDQPIWAVATPEKVLISECTYAAAVNFVEGNRSIPGVAIITAEAAQRQLQNKERHGKSGTAE